MSKPGADPTSGISLGDALRLPERHPVCRRRLGKCFVVTADLPQQQKIRALPETYPDLSGEAKHAINYDRLTDPFSHGPNSGAGRSDRALKE